MEEGEGLASGKHFSQSKRAQIRLRACALAHTDYTRARHIMLKMAPFTVPDGLPWRCPAGEKRSLDVRAHIRYLWRCLMKKLVPQPVPVRR